MGVLNVNVLESSMDVPKPVMLIENRDRRQSWMLHPIRQETCQPSQLFWDGLYGRLYQQYTKDTDGLLEQRQ